ncbi:MAG: CoA transferase [Proteobacteria bacterium]|nr:CoA transferase [Pseudomonadota bacterium]
MSEAEAGALAGVRIVDVSQVISGPVATRILGDQGADVIKVEPPVGDLTRHLGGAGRGMSPIFATSNRNKRSVAIDLKQSAGVDLLKRLVARADVFVQNFRPGAVERLGFGEPELREIQPDLIYVSISGFGETGPYAHKRVYDPVIQALSGLTAIQGGTRGRPEMMRLIVPDKVTALTAAQAITAALFARTRTGRGQHLRLAMLDAVIAFMWPEGMAYHTFVGDDVAHVKAPARRDLVFETRDGYMIVGTVAHREWVGFCQAAGVPEWLEDERFSSAAGLIANAEPRLQRMGEVLETRTTAEWLEVLDAHQVPCAPVLSREELVDHPQVVENRIIVESEHPHAGRMRQARPAERLEGSPSGIFRPAPTLGQHTDEVLAEIGLGESEIEELRRKETIS